MTTAPVVGQGSDPVLPEAAAALVSTIPVALVRTNLERFRSVQPRRCSSPQLRELPLRVVPAGDGCFEIVDGFKRFAQEARPVVPVVVESARSTIEQKLLLLRANAPPRTTTPMDEARVIRALLDEDGLGLAGVAQLLGRRKPWVVRRLTLATKLSPSIERKVDQGAIGPTLGYALCALSEQAQEDIVRATERHSLRQREALALVSAWRVASSDGERAGLLSDPLPVVRPDPKSTSLLGPLAARLEEQLARARDALADLASFQLPPERRRLEAQHRSVLELLEQTAQALQSTSELKEHPDERTRGTEPHYTPEHRSDDEHQSDAEREEEEEESRGVVGLCRRASADPRAPEPPLWNARDCAAGQPRPQDRPPDPRGGGDHQPPTAGPGEQARPIPRDDPGESCQAPDGDPHPPGDPAAGLHGRPVDLDRLHPFDPGGCSPPHPRQTSF